MLKEQCNFILTAIDFSSVLRFCCSDFGRKISPKLAYSETGTETALKFIKWREELFAEMAGEKPKELIKCCSGCRDLTQSNNVNALKKIKNISIDFYPSVCNCKCVYCNVWDNPKKNNVEQCKKDNIPDKIAEIIDVLDSEGLFADKVNVCVASGEISVHPGKDKLLATLVRYAERFNCDFFTNAYIFSQPIADTIKLNPLSKIVVSLDSGTREVFKILKQADMFYKVLENLSSYRRYGNLRLKYIVMPRLNDSVEDFNGFINICKALDTNIVSVTYDNRNPLNEATYRSIALMIVMCREAKINIPLQYTFTQEQKEILNDFLTFKKFDERIAKFMS